MTLKQIKEFALRNGACPAQYHKFVEFLEDGNELEAWRTVLGNYDWLCDKGFQMKLKEVVELADNIGKEYHDNGQLFTETTYKGKVIHGLYREYYITGELACEHTYKENKRDGLYRDFSPEGNVLLECTYKNDVRDGLYREWYIYGQLASKVMYKNGVRDGLYRLWEPDGKLVTVLLCENGKIFESNKNIPL